MAEQLDRLTQALAEHYAVEQEVGRGGMATVYLARDLRHERRVAIKVLNPELATLLGPERFLREIKVTAQLSHPHILPLLDSGEADGLLYYVMPYVEGESLRARLQREGQLPLDDALQITRDVADALAHAHAHNIVHRDIKPENILQQGGHAVVTDFGIARAIDHASGGTATLTQTGTTVGTPAYMSPEQASGETRLDGRSDIYSLSCVVYEMLGGEPPHTDPTPRAILARQLSGEVPRLSTLRSTITPALEQVVRRGLAPTPADRYATALQFATALTAASTGGRRVSAPWPRLRPVHVAVAVAAVLALAGWWAVRRIHQPVAPDQRLGIAVFPFRAAGAEAQEWSETLPDFLATALDGTPELRVSDPSALWRTLRPTRDARAQSPDADEAQRLAARAGARRFVLGSVAETDGRLDLNLRIYVAGVADPLGSLAAVGSVDSLPALIQSLAVQILKRVWRRGQSPTVTNVASYTTRSADALKAYLAAKEAMRRGFIDSAETAIGRALALDSTFALALVEATRIKTWAQFTRAQPFTGLDTLAERAVRYGDSLPESGRLWATATLALIQTRGVAAADALQRIVQRDSSDVQAWAMLAYCHSAYGWQYHRGRHDALSAIDHALALDPSDAPALVTRAWLAEASDNRDTIAAQLAALRGADTTLNLIRSTREHLEALLLSDSAFPALADSVAQQSPTHWIAVLRSLRANRPDRADLLLARIRAVAGPGLPTGIASGASAQFAIAAGRLRQTDSLIRNGAYAGAFARQLDLFLVASAIAGIEDSAVTARAVASLRRYIPRDSALAYFNQRPVWWTGWVLGAYEATHGDTTAARRWWETVGTLPAGGTSGDYRGAIQADIDARLEARNGKLEAALHDERDAYEKWAIHSNNVYEATPEPAMRFHLASLLAATGRPDSAEWLYRSLVPPTTWMGFYTARASLELAQLEERRGDRAAAAKDYARALALWRLGGDEVAPWRDQAETGLRRVVAEPRR